MKTRFWILGMIVMFSLLFAGCNGDGDGGGSTPPPPPAPGAGPGGGDGDGNGGIDVTGTWPGTIFTGSTSAYTLVLVQTNGTVTGTGSNGAVRSYSGTLTGTNLVLTSGSITFDLAVSGNTMVGTYTDSTWTDSPASFTR